MPDRELSPSTIWGLRLIVVTVVALVAGAVYLASRSGPGTPESESSAGVTVTVSSRLLDFGTVPLQASAVRKLVLRNDGQEPVHAVMSLEGDAFHINTPKRVTLQPGGRSIVNVQLKPDAPGSIEDRLRIHLDLEPEPLLITLKARAGERDAATRSEELAVAKQRAVERRAEAMQRAVERNEAGERARRATRTGSDSGQTGRQGAIIAEDSNATGSARRNAAAGPEERGGSDGTGRSATPSAATEQAGGRPLSRAPAGARPVVVAFDPSRSTPIVDLTQREGAVGESISAADRAAARSLPEQAPGVDADADPDDLFEEPEEPAANPREPARPATAPTLTISSASIVTLIGTSVSFYPQQIGVIGSDRGGPLQLGGAIQFPLVPLAFGESMAITQAGPSSGVFDAASGSVVLGLPLILVDADGNGAPVNIQLTTGTTYGRTEAGIVVALSGSPRTPGSNLLKLVGLHQIPTGFRNGAEQHLVAFEILARLDFGGPATGSTESNL